MSRALWWYCFSFFSSYRRYCNIMPNRPSFDASVPWIWMFFVKPEKNPKRPTSPNFDCLVRAALLNDVISLRTHDFVLQNGQVSLPIAIKKWTTHQMGNVWVTIDALWFNLSWRAPDSGSGRSTYFIWKYCVVFVNNSYRAICMRNRSSKPCLLSKYY